MGALWPEPRRNALCQAAGSVPSTAPGYGCLRQSFSEVWWQEVNPADYGGQWGGEVAAALLGTVLKPQQSLLYLQPEAMRLGLARLIREQGLRPDPGGSGDVELLEVFWSNERLGLSGATVPIPLVIADLQASLDSRNIEAALELRRSWIHGVED